MQASLKLNTNHSQYIIVTFSNDATNQMLQQKHLILQQESLNHMQYVERNKNQSELKFPHIDPIFQYSSLNQEAYPCKRCKCWKQWASAQEQNLLQIQASLIEKQMLLKSIVLNLQKQIKFKDKKIDEYQKLFQEDQFIKKQLDIKIKNISNQLSKKYQKKIANLADKQTQVSKRQTINTYSNKYTQIQICQSKITTLVDQQTIITPQKQNQDHLSSHVPKKIQLPQLSKYSIKQALAYEKINYAKNSTVATKTDGWMSTHTKFMETNDKFMPASNQIERKVNYKFSQGTMTNKDKTLFQNQILRDYNYTLVERLRTSKLKKYF